MSILRRPQVGRNARCAVARTFDVAGVVPPGATVLSAGLNLYMFSSSRPDDSLQIRRTTEPWAEGGVTWSTHGWNSGAYDSVVEDSLLTGTPGWKVWDVTALVQAWVDGTYADYGFYLLNNSAGGGHDDEYRSREYADSNFHPYLEITYLP
ncbi:MAG: DNRLRE domain-containing protein, partial [SAR324 cluster bacterium]|nr:DNRLRE domain-containing protein [SAR324 cluster bacterium]